jgi:hypothetical protein
MRPAIVALCLVLELAYPARGRAQQDTSKARKGNPTTGAATNRPGSSRGGRLLGVFDDETGQPIADAEVVDLFIDGIARTEVHGLVELSHFQSRHDSVAVRVRKLGYTDTAFVVMVGPSDTVPVQINLRKAAVGLPTVTTEAVGASALSMHMQEFEDRRKMGFGKYILPAEMRRNDDRNIKDILIAHGIVMNPHGCRGSVKVILNGNPSTTAGEREMALRDTGANFEAVEFYTPAATPLQFGGTAAQMSCGVVVLWTRERR